MAKGYPDFAVICLFLSSKELSWVCCLPVHDFSSLIQTLIILKGSDPQLQTVVSFLHS